MKHKRVITTVLALTSIALASLGCKSPFGTDNISNKYVYFYRDSVNLHPPSVKVVEGSYADDEEGTGTEMVLPDGSYVTLTGGGAAGNLMLVVNQNDGTDQDAKTDAKASAAATVNSPNSTTDTGDNTTEEPDEPVD